VFTLSFVAALASKGHESRGVSRLGEFQRQVNAAGVHETHSPVHRQCPGIVVSGLDMNRTHTTRRAKAGYLRQSSLPQPGTPERWLD
jgi:hypothetical protein